MKSLTLAILLALTLGTLRAESQDPVASATVRIGTYDSRAVALSWGRSPEHAKQLQALLEAHKAGGRAQRKEAKRKGGEMQVRLHQRVFSTAGAADLLKGREAELAALAAEAGVVAVVSVWELPFLAPAVERVDLTRQVAALFQPDEATWKHVEGISAQPPIPLDELPLDPRM